MLISCYECGGHVSDKAYTCPHCGNPLRGAIAHGGGILGWLRAKKCEREVLRRKKIAEKWRKGLTDGTIIFHAPFDITYYIRGNGPLKIAYKIAGAETFYQRWALIGERHRKCEKMISYAEAMPVLLSYLTDDKVNDTVVGVLLYLAFLNHDTDCIDKIKSSKAYHRNSWQGPFLQGFFADIDSTSFVEFYENFVGDVILTKNSVREILSNRIGAAIVRKDQKLISWWSSRGLCFEIGNYCDKIQSRITFRPSRSASVHTSGEKTTLLATAVDNDDYGEARYLLSYNANPNVYMGYYSQGECDPMLTHIKSVEMLQLLLEHGLDLHIPSSKATAGAGSEDGKPEDLFWIKLNLKSDSFDRNISILDYLESINEDRQCFSKFLQSSRWFSESDYSIDGFRKLVRKLNEYGQGQGDYLEKWFMRACKKYGTPKWAMDLISSCSPPPALRAEM